MKVIASEVPEPDELLELAWGVIANVDWDNASEEWLDAAMRWRDNYTTYLDAQNG